VVAGKVNLTFVQLYQHNQLQLMGGTMPFSFQKIKPSLWHTIAGAFAECLSPQKADAMVCRKSRSTYSSNN